MAPIVALFVNYTKIPFFYVVLRLLHYLFLSLYPQSDNSSEEKS